MAWDTGGGGIPRGWIVGWDVGILREQTVDWSVGRCSKRVVHGLGFWGPLRGKTVELECSSHPHEN